MDENEFVCDGVKYYALKQSGYGCDGCSFFNDEQCNEPTAPCMTWEREDHNDVIFVEKRP